MDYYQAKNKILALWKNDKEGKAYEGVKKEEYKQMYFAILPHLYSGNREWQNASGTFLLRGALAYDRFLTPRPQIVDEELYVNFCRFLTALQKMDGEHFERTAFLHLEKLKWDIYRECSMTPYDSEMEIFLAQSKKDVEKIVLTRGEERIIANIEKAKEDLICLIDGIRNGKVKTKIHTTLPFKLTNSDKRIRMNIDGVAVVVCLTHHSQGSSLPIARIAEGSTMTTTGPSKWTTTTCELDIEASCLIDFLEERPRVTLRNDKEGNGYWTTVFDFTFRVVTTIWSFFQKYEEVSGTWPPLPNDIHYINCHIFVDDKECDGEFTTNPALIYHVTPLKKDTDDYDISENCETRWSDYAYMFAKLYSQTGQFKEAIFWINVSTEALVEEFIRQVATSKEMLAEIDGEEHKFDTAEEILCNQFPEMKGKVKWPNIVIHTSVFTKLKRAIKMSKLSIFQNDIIKKYQQINAKRNGLFHGNNIEIDVEDVEKAFVAYAWLKEKLRN